jgi:hypothetical protein
MKITALTVLFFPLCFALKMEREDADRQMGEAKAAKMYSHLKSVFIIKIIIISVPLYWLFHYHTNTK